MIGNVGANNVGFKGLYRVDTKISTNWEKAKDIGRQENIVFDVATDKFEEYLLAVPQEDDSFVQKALDTAKLNYEHKQAPAETIDALRYAEGHATDRVMLFNEFWKDPSMDPAQAKQNAQQSLQALQEKSKKSATRPAKLQPDDALIEKRDGRQRYYERDRDNFFAWIGKK